MEELIEKIKEYKIIVICAGLGLVLGGFFLLKPVAQTPAKESNLQTEVTTVSKDSASEKEEKSQKSEAEEVVEKDLITVDVKGAVKSPGIYDLPVGSRINDAVQKAGGLTDNADSKSINLAQRISDEALVYVPTKEEATSQEAHSNASNTKENKKVNLNKASLEELKQVKGLGGKRAQDIIDHRETNGKFKSVDDLKKVSGIGAKTVEKLKEYVTVD
ncbi:helix-hairpin-helix domain-containing protein [Streptococcus sp. oral taxon 431]|uniref:helix-hairpin-helix domain-containing protein n=1 Tax=Streptococcus sp. oral taxon 431 TaxID=712633 RepID=UPI00066B09E7|nr:helix-hairpin-helix domain-containing protein [Streptococcus sp. oral taxon 431]